MSNSDIDNQGGYRIWDSGSAGRQWEELFEYLVIIGFIILIAKVFL